MRALRLAAAAGVTLWRDGDGIGYDGEMTGELADTITAERQALLTVLPTEIEAEALRDGWTRDAGGWHFPASWPRSLPQPEATLPPLTAEQRAQVGTSGAPMPPGVSYGQTATGQWRRLT